MYSLILLSGGNGSRMQKSIPKQYLMIGGKPIIMHTLDKVDSLAEINEIIIVCSEKYKDLLENYIRTYSLKNNYIFVDSGATRQESVYNGLQSVSNESVIIHEAARPFVKIEEFKTIIADDSENVIFASPINFTVLKGNEIVTDILNREELLNIQLPQKYRKDILLQSHEKALEEGKNFTEDASMVFNYLSKPIKILTGTPYNIKITEPIDMITGEIIYKEYIVGER
jgi:2-C-methyl-D-erythritol 4-phosphate cytidylyltransferase